MLGFERLYVVDYHKELLDELRKNFDRQNIVYVRNNGTDFPSIERNTVDFVFSFGVFVHLDVEIINDYLLNLKHVIKSDGNIVIQYSDKDKIAAKDPSFSENNPRVMRSIVERAGYEILEEDTTTLPHSSIMRFGLPRD
jgi:cyclopropane fatty-acyl-phospholipid synthase-like methyltransferase